MVYCYRTLKGFCGLIMLDARALGGKGVGGGKSELFRMRHFIINFTLAVLCYVLSFNAFVRCYIHGCSVLLFRWRQPVSPAIPPRYHLSYRESFTFTWAPRTLQIRITSQARSASKPKAFISCSSPSRDRAQVTSDVSAIKLSDQDAQLNPNLTGRLQKQTSDRLHPWVMHDWGSLPGDVEILCHNLNHKSPTLGAVVPNPSQTHFTRS